MPSPEWKGGLSFTLYPVDSSIASALSQGDLNKAGEGQCPLSLLIIEK